MAMHCVCDDDGGVPVTQSPAVIDPMSSVRLFTATCNDRREKKVKMFQFLCLHLFVIFTKTGLLTVCVAIQVDNILCLGR